MSCHRGIATLYKLILNQNFIWYNIFKDVKNYINICPSCIEVHKNNLKKLPVKQILSNSPRERYVMDLMEIDAEIDDIYQKYNYILNIIDHFSKLCKSYALKNKKSDITLNCLKDFIELNGMPKSIGTDNGR